MTDRTEGIPARAPDCLDIRGRLTSVAQDPRFADSLVIPARSEANERGDLLSLRLGDHSNGKKIPALAGSLGMTLCVMGAGRRKQPGRRRNSMRIPRLKRQIRS